MLTQPPVCLRVGLGQCRGHQMVRVAECAVMGLHATMQLQRLQAQLCPQARSCLDQPTAGVAKQMPILMQMFELVQWQTLWRGKGVWKASAHNIRQGRARTHTHSHTHTHLLMHCRSQHQ